MKIIAGMISILIVLPIWYYLLYQILERVDASEVMWLLYWVYLPAALLSVIIAKLTEQE